MIYRILVILNVLMASGSQMLLKQGARLNHPTLLRQYLNPWVLSGYIILGLSLLINIFAMSRGVRLQEIGIIESLAYLFVPCLSWIFFRERITWKKVISIIIIIVGILIFFL